MSEGYLAPKLIARWNGARGVWEKPETVNLLCEHLELFSETWPSVGTMRNGMVSELQKRERHTNDSEFSYLRSPKASEGEGGALGEVEALKRGNTVGVRDQVKDLVASQTNYLPTTRAQHGEDRNNKIYSREPGKPQNLENALANLPTPTVADTFTDKLKSSQQKDGSMHSVSLSQAVHMEWGKFEAVVRRWEEITGLVAPAPTKPDGKDGTHRLSSEFTEWMMGLPPGWVTGHGLSRKDELKACGNGVVPQQAKLALTILKARFDVE